MGKYPGISLVLEWENAKLSEAARARKMLRSVSAQLADLASDFQELPEVIITYDPEAMDETFIRSMFDGCWNKRAEVELTILAAPGLEYYGQKNLGAQHASRQWLLFVDSDVVPEAGWMKTLLETRRKSNAAIVSGETYVEPSGLVDRAFALFWFFPLRSNKTAAYDAENFYANNFVVERSYFLNHNFPESTLVRGRCYVLSHDIRKSGETIEVNPAAKVGHPPPNGFSHFFKRAIIAGHDFRAADAILGSRLKRSPVFLAASRAKWNLKAAFRKISTDGKSIGLSFSERLVARSLAFAYFGLAACGEVVSSMNAPLVRRRFSV